jgi:hypothetical protein
MTDQSANFNPLAAELIREAMTVTSLADAGRLRDSVRRRMSGRQRNDRTELEMTLALAAACFAQHCTQEKAEEVLALLEADTKDVARAMLRRYTEKLQGITKDIVNRAEKASWN